MIRCYTTEHPHSRVIMAAFAEGCGGQMVPPCALLEGPAAMYGILRGTGEIYKKAKRVGRETFYLDHGYIGAKHYDGYYRVARHGRQSIIDPDHNWPTDRFEKLGVEIKPWRKSGNTILIIPPTNAIAHFYGIDGPQWLGGVMFNLAKHTDRSSAVKKKEDGVLADALADAWCVVTHSSNVAVDALIEGVPVITLGESIAAPLAWNYPDIERPYYPERENWLHGVAWQQWTLSEMRSGLYAEYAGVARKKVAA